MKIGIEIHQRLATNKLFCPCTSETKDDAIPTHTITRTLHPVLSELGEVDAAIAQESMRNRTFYYQAFPDATCLVDLDEEPPHDMNQAALKTVLSIAAQLHSLPLDLVHVMRKLVIDGSNTSGFQRTAIISIGGYVETSKGKVRISQIALEEESAGIVEKTDTSATYRLDRLGVPLIEISTEPDIVDGEHLKETAEKLGLILRATGLVARGIGTIRQDVNISIEGGARVEIKGAQDLKMLPQIVVQEVRRQETLIAIHGNASGSRFSHPIMDVTSIIKDIQGPIIQKGIASGHVILGTVLTGYAGVLGREVQNGRRFGTELSDYAKQAGVKGIIHSDESLEKYGITLSHVDAIKKFLKVGVGDAFVLVVAPYSVATNALEQVVKRLTLAAVPGETRKANPDGTSSFMRPIPGKARMYPETDVAPLVITQELRNGEVRESLDKKKSRLEKILNPELAKKMIKSVHLGFFESLIAEGYDPMLVATTLENTLVTLKRDSKVELTDPGRSLVIVLRAHKEGKIAKAAIPEILKEINNYSLEAIIEKRELRRFTKTELEKIARSLDYDIKKIMAVHRLRIETEDLQTIIKKDRR